MTTKFTPGPWNVERDDNGRPASIGHRHYLIASLSGPKPEANAALIASAPDLYRACEELVALWEKEGGHFLKLDSPSIVRARAALKRARGEA